MGIVFEAYDDRLGRAVALKTVRLDRSVPAAVDRLWREARSLARVNHPNICQIFDVEAAGDCFYLVLELLQGESLFDRLKRGPVPPAEAALTARQIAAALTALHESDIIHRDLKPSNVFLTPHGIKLLDFGLAQYRPLRLNSEETATLETSLGMIAGTPQYMAPEQARGLECGPASDIFAAGCVLYEMLSGQPPFRGESVVDVLYGILHHESAPLTGSPLVESLDRLIRRALAKVPGDRWPSAAALENALENALASVETGAAAISHAAPHAVRRLIVLPFLMLRKDEETEFLAYSLPDAITNSLSGLNNLIVRSSMVAARFAGGADPKQIAREAQVDAILTGALLRHGTEIRVSCQLSDAMAGDLRWSHTCEISIQDLFMVQDQLVNRIAASLLPSLSDREQRQFDLNVSRSAAAYEYFLRGNQLVWARGIDNARLARDLYRQCLVLDEGFAPAWAALGRVLRFIYKFGDENEVTLEAVDDAFRRAFALNPDLALAHNFYTLAQCDLGRAPDAMVRLLERARFRRHDADLFAGLVQACRYSGELHASVAAHERVRALDSHVATSVAHTYFLLGDYRKTLESYTRGASFYLDCAALASLGEEQEALTRLRERHATLSGATVVSPLIDSLAALLQGDYEGCIRIGAAEPLRCHRDPEVTYYQARHVARAGSPSLALEMLEAAIAQGFLCVAALESDPWLASVRSLAAFTGALQRAHELRREIRSRFESAGGAQVL